MLIMDTNFLVAIRLLAFLLFLYTSFIFSYQAVVVALCFAGTIVILKPKRQPTLVERMQLERNPLKGKPPESTLISSELESKIEKTLYKLLTYEATSTESLQNFDVIKMNTECIFAKKSRLWGSSDWIPDTSVEENVYHILPTFLKFTMVCEDLGLDGFVLQIPKKYSSDVKMFGKTVLQVLSGLSQYDPRGLDCMRDTNINRRGWVYRFHIQTFFITTFAACYAETHSRYNFGSDYGYILFQPEISFAQHDLPDDTVDTNWEHPQSVRDRIRVAFHNVGRGYKIRDTLTYPMVYDLVKPIDPNVDFFEWWESRE